jgi:membrane-associated phospholipid phosphatase
MDTDEIAPQTLEALAVWLAQHALLAYGIALVLLLTASWLFWRLVLHFAGPSGGARLPPLASFLVRIGCGFLIILTAAAVFAQVADEVLEAEALDRIDRAFTQALAQHTPLPVLHFFAVLTRLGDTATLTAVCIAVAIALVVNRRHALAAAWVLTVAGGGTLNTLLKRVFERSRPAADGWLVSAEGFTFPSGHSAGSVVTYGMLAYLAMRLLPGRAHVPVALLLAALAATIGASRMFLRVHYASDVLAGFALGVAWLGLCIVSIELTRWWHERRAPR